MACRSDCLKSRTPLARHLDYDLFRTVRDFSHSERGARIPERATSGGKPCLLLVTTLSYG